MTELLFRDKVPTFFYITPLEIKGAGGFTHLFCFLLEEKLWLNIFELIGGGPRPGAVRTRNEIRKTL